MNPLMRACLILPAVLLAACNQTAGEPTLAASASAAEASAPSAPSGGQATSDRISLSMFASPLEDVAQGKTAPPSTMNNMAAGMMATMRTQIVAQQAMGIASTVASGVMSGGIGLAAAAPGLAMQAAATGATLGALSSAEAQMNQEMAKAEAQRLAEQTVPEEDRPSEARAILTLVNAPSGRSATWSNPETGSSGKVTVRRNFTIAGNIACRSIQQDWKRGGDTASGESSICRQNGVWYALPE